MILSELLILIGTIAGLFIWNRSEWRKDIRRIEELLASIHAEMKDFHGRLCALEEKSKVK